MHGMAAVLCWSAGKRPGLFSRTHLREFVRIAKAALQEADTHIRKALESNPAYEKDGALGLRWMDNERDYKFLIWEALIGSSFPFAVELELERYDFTVCLPSDTDRSRPIARGEMKRWVSYWGDREIPEIKKDIKKLRRCNCQGFVLISTEQVPDEADGNYDFLADKLADLGISRACFETLDFPTVRRHGRSIDELQFALIGFLVNPPA